MVKSMIFQLNGKMWIEIRFEPNDEDYTDWEKRTEKALSDEFGGLWEFTVINYD